MIGLCVLHTALVLFVFFGSLYIQVIQGFIHDDHEDLINKYVMMIRATNNFSVVIPISHSDLLFPV